MNKYKKWAKLIDIKDNFTIHKFSDYTYREFVIKPCKETYEKLNQRCDAYQKYLHEPTGKYVDYYSIPLNKQSLLRHIENINRVVEQYKNEIEYNNRLIELANVQLNEN